MEFIRRVSILVGLNRKKEKGMLINFRDLGGIKTKDGQRIMEKRLLRCGNTSFLQEEDQKELLERYRLKTIVDMRSESETKEQSDPEIEGVHHVHLDYFKDKKEKHHIPSMEEFMKNVAAEKVDFDYFMEKAYLEIISLNSAREGISNFFKILLDQTQGSVLWHCSAGKDRTGVSAALLLEVLGVSRELIMEDYLKSNQAAPIIMETLLLKVEKNKIPEGMIEKMMPAVMVKEGYLEKVWGEIDSQYGSVESYLSQEANITLENIKELKKMYLEKGL